MKPLLKLDHPEFGELLAIQWNGLNLPGDWEEFASFGYFEDDNGYDLESCDLDFQLEVRGRNVRDGDWILKNSNGKFSHVSNDYFQYNLKRFQQLPKEDVKSSPDEKPDREWTKEEKMIRDALLAVEAIGASPKLTECVISLSYAQKALKEHLDEVN